LIANERDKTSNNQTQSKQLKNNETERKESLSRKQSLTSVRSGRKILIDEF